MEPKETKFAPFVPGCGTGVAIVSLGLTSLTCKTGVTATPLPGPEELGRQPSGLREPAGSPSASLTGAPVDPTGVAAAPS